MKELKFPADVEMRLHELCARAIQRAIDNGTYQYIPPLDELKEQNKENNQRETTG